jgi:hypothetical protein
MGNLGLTWFTTARTRGKPTPSPIQYSLRYSVALTSGNDFFFPGLPKWSLETVLVWTPETLGIHSTCTHRDQVDSRLLMVGSQTGSLTPGLSFDHNLCYRCPNGSCEAILDIYTSRPFQRYKEHLKARCFDPCNRTLSFGSPRGLSSPIFGSVSDDLTLPSMWGCDMTTSSVVDMVSSVLVFAIDFNT